MERFGKVAEQTQRVQVCESKIKAGHFSVVNRIHWRIRGPFRSAWATVAHGDRRLFLRSTGTLSDLGRAVQLQRKWSACWRESFGTEPRPDRPGARAKQRVLQISAPSECSSTAESDGRTPGPRTPGGRMRRMKSTAQPAQPAAIDASPRGTRALVCWRRDPPPRHGYSVGFPRMHSDFGESVRPLSCFREVAPSTTDPTSLTSQP